MLCLFDNGFEFVRFYSLVWVHFSTEICFCQAFLGGDWAAMVGLPQSRANLAVTSGQGTLNLWGFWG